MKISTLYFNFYFSWIRYFIKKHVEVNYVTCNGKRTARNSSFVSMFVTIDKKKNALSNTLCIIVISYSTQILHWSRDVFIWILHQIFKHWLSKFLVTRVLNFKQHLWSWYRKKLKIISEIGSRTILPLKDI